MSECRVSISQPGYLLEALKVRCKVLQTPFLPKVTPTHRQPVPCAYHVIISCKTGLIPGALLRVIAACVSELPDVVLNEVETLFVKPQPVTYTYIMRFQSIFHL